MNLDQAIQLIDKEKSVFSGAVRWADLGCGTGLFTHALAQLLPADSVIYAVDSNQAVLEHLPKPDSVQVIPHQLNFQKDTWPFHQLDGILMANSLHYVFNKRGFIQKIQSYLNPVHQFLIVEYDRTWPNPWVPYPINYTKLSALFLKLGYTKISRLGQRPSVYGNGQIYAASIRK